jgi:hypothetical protein
MAASNPPFPIQLQSFLIKKHFFKIGGVVFLGNYSEIWEDETFPTRIDPTKPAFSSIFKPPRLFYLKIPVSYSTFSGFWDTPGIRVPNRFFDIFSPCHVISQEHNWLGTTRPRYSVSPRRDTSIDVKIWCPSCTRFSHLGHLKICIGKRWRGHCRGARVPEWKLAIPGRTEFRVGIDRSYPWTWGKMLMPSR